MLPACMIAWDSLHTFIVQAVQTDKLCVLYLKVITLFVWQWLGNYCDSLFCTQKVLAIHWCPFIQRRAATLVFYRVFQKKMLQCFCLNISSNIKATKQRMVLIWLERRDPPVRFEYRMPTCATHGCQDICKTVCDIKFWKIEDMIEWGLFSSCGGMVFVEKQLSVKL